MGEKVSVRFSDQQLRIIDRYATLIGSNRSAVIRQFCRSGSQNIANMKLQSEFMEEQRERWLKLPRVKLIDEMQNLIFKRDGNACRKCGKGDMYGINVYSIDKDPLNKDPAFKITLCDNCMAWAEKYSPKRRVLEDFVEWFCLL
jgi:hypothetical protein